MFHLDFYSILLQLFRFGLLRLLLITVFSALHRQKRSRRQKIKKKLNKCRRERSRRQKIKKKLTNAVGNVLTLLAAFI